MLMPIGWGPCRACRGCPLPPGSMSSLRCWQRQALCAINSHRHAALIHEFERGALGLRNVERVNGLIHAVVMDSHGIYMSPAVETAKRFAVGLLKFNDQIGDVVAQWRQSVASEHVVHF